MTGKAVRVLLCGLVGSVAVGGCRGSDNAQKNRSPLPAAAPVVVVSMGEYSFDYHKTIPRGRAVFRFVNEGRVAHRPALLPLPEDVPPIAEQLRGSKRRTINPFGGVSDRPPGATGTFAVDLQAGRRYALICYARDPDGSSHALKGMASEFRAR